MNIFFCSYFNEFTFTVYQQVSTMASATTQGRLKGKRCVVTGAAQGNSAQVTHRLCKHHAQHRLLQPTYYFMHDTGYYNRLTTSCTIPVTTIDLLLHARYRLLQSCMCTPHKVNGKVFYARSLPVENLLPQNVGSIINYFQ